MGLTRRVVIGSGLTVAAIGGVSLLACGWSGTAATAGLNRLERLNVLLTSLPEPDRIGRAVIDTVQDDALFGMAAANAHIPQALLINCDSSRYAFLRKGVRLDFHQNDVVLCDRFVLSRTECLVAGLAFARSWT